MLVGCLIHSEDRFGGLFILLNGGESMSVLENARHEKFVQCLISGMTQRKAYREAFASANRWKDATVDNKASALFRENEILARYKELQEAAQDEAIMTRKARMVKLSEIANDDEYPGDQIRAIDTLNKMDGIYTNKVEMSGSIEIPLKDKEAAAKEWLEGLVEDG